MSAAPPNEYVNITNTRLHGGWLLYKSSQHIGTLHLAPDSSIHIRDGDVKTGFKFDLHTAKRKNKFKAKTLYDREAWRVYIEGLTTGKVPESIILSPRELSEIQDKLVRAKRSTATSAPPHPVSPPPQYGSPPGGTTTPFSNQMRRGSIPSVDRASSASGGFEPPRDHLSAFSDSSGSGGSLSRLDPGGPFMHHKFFPAGHPGDSREHPPWFFENCSRELACRILSECTGAGNTLMRESLSNRPTGSYAISKRMERTGEITHYEVIRVAEGYKINVQNPHQPMKTLSDVMEFFKQLSGPTTTHLMKTNNMKELGVEYAAYTKRIQQVSYDEESGEGDDLSPPAPSSLKSSAATWSSKKVPELSEGARGNQTVGAGGFRQSEKRPPGVSMLELKQRLDEQNAMQKFDDILKDADARPSDVPPPLPKVPANRPKLDASGHPIYVNQTDAGVKSPRPVPHSVSAPNMVLAGGRQPPPVAAKPNRGHTHHTSISSDDGNGSAGSVAASNETHAVPSRRLSMPNICMWRRIRQRLSSRRGSVPLPLPPPPDYSSVSEESSSSDDESDNYIDNKDISACYSAAGDVSDSNTDSGVKSWDVKSVEMESDVYYTEVLGEDEVVYDLMYVSGGGGIQLWQESQRLSGTGTGSNGNLAAGGQPPAQQASATITSGLVQELQAKLNLGQAVLKHVERNDCNSGNSTARQGSQPPAAEDEDVYYEDINEYQNMPQSPM
ncbi:hypothetical protein BaRGS_00024249 [Batillaria attramentaria]|uniref:SH2 domain-containing protein n=1 Tax=Batillaria attramentaria TaxID=370345 RepID=A0ABD0KBL9_9CAEN